MNSNQPKNQNPLSKHSQKPEVDNSVSEEFFRAMRIEIQSSPYFEYISSLKELVVGKIVLTTYSGTSGFVLFFTDGSWVMAYLRDKKLVWKKGDNELNSEDLLLLNLSEYGDGHKPLSVNQPYATEICDIPAELANVVGRKIEGIAIGSECFNFCFPNGMELDTSIVPTANGKYALRVFWEQW